MSVATRRIELSDGGWAEVRRAKMKDSIEVENERRSRGAENDMMDALVKMRCCIVSWSKGAVTIDELLELDDADALEIMRAMNDRDPNASTPSSAGGEGAPGKNR